MSKEHGLVEEYRNNGIASVIKRLFYYIPNHYIISRVKKRKLTYGLNTEERRKKKIIVSLTSYPLRFSNIYLCLKSLLCQTVKPDKIIVWLGSDATEADLTDEMKSLEQYGVEYKFDRKNNLKPHKKYYYAMQEYPEDIIITVDDDAVYLEKTLESLMKSYLRYPTAVSARRVHKITYNEKGNINPYEKWLKEYRKERKDSFELIAVGVGGVLYPPHSLNDSAFNIEDIKTLCLGADDIWLKCMEMLNGTKVVWVPCFFAHPPALGITTSLWQGNVNEDQNDIYLSLVSERYKLIFERDK